jgi:hypothetical protein
LDCLYKSRAGNICDSKIEDAKEGDLSLGNVEMGWSNLQADKARWRVWLGDRDDSFVSGVDGLEIQAE